MISFNISISSENIISRGREIVCTILSFKETEQVNATNNEMQLSEA